MENSDQPIAQTTARTAPETEHLSKIRALLFGEHLQNQNQRFEQLEQQITTTCRELHAQITQEINSLESRLTQQVSDLSQQFEKQMAEQASELRAHTSTAVAATNQTLQSNLQQHSEALKRTIDHQTAATIDNLQTQIKTQKSHERAERVHLSALFSEISQKLNNTDETSS